MSCHIYCIIKRKTLERESDCYMLMLDASKSVDRVEYVRLFTLLREKALCPVVFRPIINVCESMYTNKN